MKILITGSSGLIGSQLIPFLEKKGNEVYRLIRDPNKISDSKIFWDPENKVLDTESLENFHVIINLAGENIASRRWSTKQKEKILHSRINGTTLLAEKLNATRNSPQLFISASATGYYGDRGDEILTESSEIGSGFLADVVKNWEKSASIVKDRPIRIVYLRTGVVLSSHGGALAKMLLPFNLGLGAVVGSGNQYMPWISIEDVIQAIGFIIANEKISGPLNLVAPNPVTNYQYSKALTNALSRPLLFKAPAFALRGVLGEMADALLLSSSRVIPQKLIDHGYSFAHPTIDEALRAIFVSRR
jgi:uncharacterized protein (TIGR01777 family)